jgi:O-antigen/teichoic acid export membrane protein
VVAVGSLLSAAVSFALFKKTMVASVDAEKNASSFWRSVRMGLPYGTSSAIFAVSRQTPLLILALTAVATEVANFRVAVSVYAAAQIVAVAINHEVLRPRLYAKRDGWPQILKITFGLNIVIGLVSLVLFHWGADKICLILFGNDFRESGRVLAILAFAVPLFFVSAWCDTIIIAASGARSVLIRLLAGLLIGMILALLLSKNGAVGVAVSIPISEFVSLLLISRPVVQLIRNLSKNGVIIRKMECQ